MIAGAYARYSTEHQCSIEVQFAKIKQYCQEHNLSLSPNHMYDDAALSGMTTRRRKGFAELIEAAQSKAIDCIVVYDLTRGSRDIVDWFSFRKNMQKMGIKVYSVMDKLGDLDNPSDFLAELISVGIGQSHVLTSRQKSMDKVDMLASQGKFLGGYAPYGYKIIDGQYQIVEDEARLVRMIFKMYADGSSYNDILSCIPPGTTGRRGGPFGRNSFNSILRNERYIGTYSWCKRKVKYLSEWAGGGPSDRAVTIPQQIPPIIDSTTWERVRKRMRDNKKNTMNNSKPDREYLLSGVLRCGKCGAALFGVTTRNTKGCEYKFYKCGNKHNHKNCDAKNLPANDIEPLIVALLRSSLLDGSMIDAAADAIYSQAMQFKKHHNKGKGAAIKTQIAQNRQKIENIFQAIEKGIYSESLQERLSGLEETNRALEEQLRLEESSGKIDITREDICASLREDVRRLQENPKSLKSLIKKYITSIVVTDDTICIHSFADLSLSPLAKDVIETKNNIPGDSAEDVSANGCGDRI